MTAVSSNVPERSSRVSPIDCAPWCEAGDGHPDAAVPADQYCTSISFPTLISREEQALYSDGTTRPAQATVYATRDEGEPAFVALVNQHDGSMQLTPGEARELAATLRHAAWLAEQNA
jgi:hypothetical protein